MQRRARIAIAHGRISASQLSVPDASVAARQGLQVAHTSDVAEAAPEASNQADMVIPEPHVHSGDPDPVLAEGAQGPASPGPAAQAAPAPNPIGAADPNPVGAADPITDNDIAAHGDDNGDDHDYENDLMDYVEEAVHTDDDDPMADAVDDGEEDGCAAEPAAPALAPLPALSPLQLGAPAPTQSAQARVRIEFPNPTPARAPIPTPNSTTGAPASASVPIPERGARAVPAAQRVAWPAAYNATRKG